MEKSNILDGYNAGWLAPNGDFYGAKGAYSQLLHIRIADNLRNDGLIPVTDEAPDYWLDKNGWARIHNGHILFGAYSMFYKQVSPKVIQITKEQIDAIYRYGQTCCDGKLFLGDERKFMSAARFELSSEMVLRDYFA